MKHNALAEIALEELNKRKITLTEYNSIINIIFSLYDKKSETTVLENVYKFFKKYSDYGYTVEPEGIGWVVYKTSKRSSNMESRRRRRMSEGRQVTDVRFPWSYMSDNRGLSKADIRKRLDKLEDALAEISDGFRKLISAVDGLDGTRLDVYISEMFECPLNAEWNEFSMEWDEWASDYYNALEDAFEKIQ